MAQNFRLATFNCENLFDRPKIFASSAATANKLLGYLGQLQAELREAVFDKSKIKSLLEKLKGYATLNEVRGKYTNKDVQGANEWLGWIEVTRGKNPEIAVKNTARVIADVDAEVICLMEVENRITLQRFHDQLLVKEFLQPQNRQGYKYIHLIDGNDDRGIDVAVLSRVPVVWLRSNIEDTTTYQNRTVRTFSRDCLEVRLKLSGGREFHLMINHLKSKRPAKNDTLSNDRRRGQATRLAELVAQHNLQSELLAVAGDLNDTPDGGSLSPLLSNPSLYNVNLELPADQRGTYSTGKQQLDYILLSDALKAGLKNVRIERRGVYTKKWPIYDTVTSKKTAASDHSAVVADFQL